MQASFLDNGLKLISFCPLCGASYDANTAKVIRELKDRYLLHIVCGKCDCAILVVVLIAAAGISSVGLVTDLSYKEVEPALSRSPISADDVIDFHKRFIS